DHVTGTVNFRGDRIEIDSLRAQVGGGTVVAGGSISVNGITPQSVRISLQGTDVAIRYFEGITVDGNFNLLLTGDKERMILGVDNLDEGGTVRLQGNKYQVTRGSITFQNPFRIDPYFDITLEGRISSGGFTSEMESGPVDVTINLTGTIDRFTPTVTSDP